MGYFWVIFEESGCAKLRRVASRADDSLSWDEALDNSLIQPAPTVYMSEVPSSTSAVSSQRLQDFRWTSAVKSEPFSGMHITLYFVASITVSFVCHYHCVDKAGNAVKCMSWMSCNCRAVMLRYQNSGFSSELNCIEINISHRRNKTIFIGSLTSNFRTDPMVVGTGTGFYLVFVQLEWEGGWSVQASCVICGYPIDVGI